MASQEFSKFTIESKKDPTSGGYNIADYDKDLRKFISALKSALPEGTFFSVGEKELGKQGKLSVDIFTHKEDANLVNKALSERASEMYYKGSTDERYKVTKRRNISDEEQQAVQREETSKLVEEQKKASEKSLRHTLGAFAKVTGAITILTDVTRRILSAVLTYATQNLEMGRSARNLGSSFTEAREARLLETAHNLPQGTITGAMSDIQQMFGNITSLDENALESLALVMGSSIKDMVMSGMGGERPNELLGKILDSYMARANAGYNSVGEYVGEVDARRELYSQLLKISPQIASLFATMVDERNNINSIYRNQFETFEEWKRLLVARGGGTDADYGMTETLAQYKSAVSAMIAQLKEGVEIKVAPLLLEALKKISQFRIGMSQEDRWSLDEENREKNRKFIEQIDRQLESFPDIGLSLEDTSITPQQRAYLAQRNVLLQAKADAERMNAKTSDVKDATLTLKQMQARANQEALRSFQDIIRPASLLPGAGEESFSTDVMWRTIEKQNVPAKDIEKARKYAIEEAEKAKIKQKKQEYDTLYDYYTLEEHLSAYMAKKKIAEKRPDLVKFGRDRRGSETVSFEYKNLSEEEKKEIAEGINAPNSRELALMIFSEYGLKYKLFESAEQKTMDLLAEEVIGSQAFAQSLLPSDAEVNRIVGNKLAKGTYGTAGVNRDGTYTIVLDINGNGKVDSKDIVLTQLEGGVFAEGSLGIQYNVDENTITKITANSDSASSAISDR